VGTTFAGGSMRVSGSGELRVFTTILLAAKSMTSFRRCSAGNLVKAAIESVT
jgi:hypothetical protein